MKLGIRGACATGSWGASIVALALAACSGGTTGDAGADATGDTGGGNDVPALDAGDAAPSDTPTPMDMALPTDTPTATDTVIPNDTPIPTDTGSTATCTIAPITSRCGVAGALRVTARLGTGMAASMGTLVVNLTHFRLGSGATAGVPHTSSSRAGVMISPTMAAELSFDLCAGGEMWSEDNCEYNLWGFLDRNGNRTPDPGEPAGRATINASCHATASPCYELILGCTTGMSCAAFTDPGLCRCATPACTGPARIVTCR